VGKDSLYSCFHANYKESSTDELLKKFFELEEVPNQEEPTIATEEQQAIDLFDSTRTHLEDGRYKVHLLRKECAPLLGESRFLAERRFLKNEYSLRRKRCLHRASKGLRSTRTCRESSSWRFGQTVSPDFLPSYAWSRKSFLYNYQAKGCMLYVMHLPKRLLDNRSMTLLFLVPHYTRSSLPSSCWGSVSMISPTALTSPECLERSLYTSMTETFTDIWSEETTESLKIGEWRG